MKFKKGPAIEAYGHCFVLFEAVARDLSIYQATGNETAKRQAEIQPYHAKIPKTPEFYKNKPPQELVIREVLGDYHHSEDQKIGDRRSGFDPAIDNITAISKRPKHIFAQLKDAQTSAAKIATAANLEIPMRYEFLEAHVDIPAIVQAGSTMFCFHRDITKGRLEIVEYLVEDATFTTDNQSRHLSIGASARDHKNMPHLYDRYFSPNTDTNWRQYKGEDMNEDGTCAFRELESFFTREAAESGASAFAKRIHKNISSFLPK